MHAIYTCTYSEREIFISKFHWLCCHWIVCLFPGNETAYQYYANFTDNPWENDVYTNVSCNLGGEGAEGELETCNYGLENNFQVSVFAFVNDTNR